MRSIHHRSIARNRLHEVSSYCQPAPLKVLNASAIILLALISWAASARCDVSVKGTIVAARIDASQATLSEVLRALETNFKIRHDAVIAVDDVIISGSYSGALEDVLRQMLCDLNYVIKTQDGTFEVIIVGRSGNAPQVPPSSPASPPHGVWDPLGVLKAKR